MPSLLVTRKMSPELAQRVLASVEGRGPGRSKLAARAKACLRFAALGLAFAIAASSLTAWRASSRAREARRAELLERALGESQGLGPDDLAAGTHVTSFIPLFGGAWAGDLVADELAGKDAFREVLARPTVYVRGALGSIGRVDEAATASFKDAFVLCLHAPPAERTEALLKQKARASLSSRPEAMAPAASVERLADLLVGMRYLAPEWQRKVRAAESQAELQRLARDFERAPIARAKRAAQAKLLLVVIDEPSTEPGPAELDGEKAHDVRVGLVDLGQKKVLLRLRRRVDPAWISVGTRAEYASAIDSCALAMDVHAAVAKQVP